nr:uncharacterized protein LOC121823531 [Peromyscus maniculatus bairdii]
MFPIYRSESPASGRWPRASFPAGCGNSTQAWLPGGGSGDGRTLQTSALRLPRPRGGAREAGPPGGAAAGQQGASVPRVTPRSPGRVLIDEDGCLCSARSSRARLGHRARPCLKQGKGPAAPRSCGARRRAGPHLRAARPPRASRLGLAHSCTEALAAVPFFQEGAGTANMPCHTQFLWCWRNGAQGSGHATQGLQRLSYNTQQLSCKHPQQLSCKHPQQLSCKHPQQLSCKHPQQLSCKPSQLTHGTGLKGGHHHA